MDLLCGKLFWELEQTRTTAFWDTPHRPWLPILVVHIRPKSKQDKVKVTNFKKLPKIQILKFCKKLYTWHTFWSCLIRCINVNGSNQNSRCYRADAGCRTDGQTDGRLQWNWLHHRKWSQLRCNPASDSSWFLLLVVVEIVVGRMDRRTDRQREWNQYTPQQLRCVGV